MPKLAILGPGGVGGLLAGAFALADVPFQLITRAATAATIQQQGLQINSLRFGEHTLHPTVVTELTDAVDYLLVATKATGLEAGLERIKVSPKLVVPLLNGLDHMAVLRNWFDQCTVAAGTIRVEADRPAPGIITHTSPFLKVHLATEQEHLKPLVNELAALLHTANVPVEIHQKEAVVLWSKLTRLNALACTTSAADLTIGEILADPDWRVQLEACVTETVAVAAAEGVHFDAHKVIGEIEAIHADSGSSMRRDIAAGRTPEVAAIPGSVLNAAARHNLSCPTVESLVTQITARCEANGCPVELDQHIQLMDFR